MAIFLSSILSDLTTRSISFLIDRRSRSTSLPTVEETLSNLQQLLRRVHVVVHEADERHISSHAMLRQLSQIRKEMYRGYLTLDTFRCRGSGAHEEKNQVRRRPFTPSSFSPAKRIRFSGGDSSSSREEQEQLTEVLGRLEDAIRDMSELVVFLSGCPRRCHQPYSMYLILDHCMFGRQMEMWRIMEFLLQEDQVPIDGETPGVLPIVGPAKVGKSTLIEHACNDERVRNHFSHIMCFRQCGTRDQRTAAALSDCLVKHCSRATGEERILVVIELIGDMDEDVWRNFSSDCKHRVAGGSKIKVIVASQSDKVARFSTTQPLKVRHLTPEEYWYFFKVRSFGSADTQDHPKLASIAMDMAQEMKGEFFCAGVLSGLLRANFDARFWSMALARLKDFKSSEYLVLFHNYETGFVQDTAQNEGPQMSIRDVLFGGNRVRPRGRFVVVAWRSHIPPHYSYMWECKVRRPQRLVSRRKRIQQIQS